MTGAGDRLCRAGRTDGPLARDGRGGCDNAKTEETIQTSLQALNAEERKMIDDMARLDGCKPTDFTIQQINLIVGQAEFIGDLNPPEPIHMIEQTNNAKVLQNLTPQERKIIDVVARRAARSASSLCRRST
jgi:hypothetical protein